MGKVSVFTPLQSGQENNRRITGEYLTLLNQIYFQVPIILLADRYKIIILIY